VAEESALDESALSEEVRGQGKRFRTLKLLHGALKNTDAAVRVEAAAAAAFAVDGTDYMMHANRVAIALKGEGGAAAADRAKVRSMNSTALTEVVQAVSKEDIIARIRA